MQEEAGSVAELALPLDERVEAGEARAGLPHHVSHQGGLHRVDGEVAEGTIQVGGAIHQELVHLREESVPRAVGIAVLQGTERTVFEREPAPGQLLGAGKDAVGHVVEMVRRHAVDLGWHDGQALLRELFGVALQAEVE